MAIYKWVEGKVPNHIEIKQVYGIVFDDNGRVLLRVDDGIYKLTGGKPEKSDSSIEETLKREFLEEVNVSLKNIHLVGYQLCDEMNGTEPFAQIRMTALIDKIGKQQPDSDNGKTYKRVLTTPLKAEELLNWGEVGILQIDSAVKIANEKLGIKEFSNYHEFID